ncbi:MAG TPA: AMP-binding protein [Kiloniellales bacterium]|nr:AMP-binding protein [Kiloniellales bacterium]
MNIAALLQKSALSFPANPALTVGRTLVHDYAGLAARAARIAGALRSELGLGAGDRVALAMNNAPAFYEWLFGIWHAGLVAVPMNAKLHRDELAYILENSGSRAAVTDKKLATGVESLAGQVRGLERVLIAGRDDVFASAEALPIAHRDGGEPAWLFYTSGTTGRPKGATLTHRNLLVMTLSYYADIDGTTPEDAILHAAPMSHGSGLYGLAHVAKAANNVIPESAGFDAAEVFELMQHHRGLMLFAAPTMVVRLMNSPAAGGDTTNLKLICYGGGPMYVADTERALSLFGPKLVQIYGQGESPMTITCLSRAMHADTAHPRFRERLASVGIARSDVEILVAGEDDRPLPAGVPGEVLVRGDVVMRGYWQNPAATTETLRGGWLHTGDIGSLDREGFLTLLDRSKDMIISGGSNIYPREVEEVLLRHPAVLEAAVVGRPDPEWGEAVVAFVVAREGQSVDAAALDRLCLERLARFKRPRDYLFEASLPKNNYGKILKRDLRQRFQARR